MCSPHLHQQVVSSSEDELASLVKKQTEDRAEMTQTPSLQRQPADSLAAVPDPAGSTVGSAAPALLRAAVTHAHFCPVRLAVASVLTALHYCKADNEWLDWSAAGQSPGWRLVQHCCRTLHCSLSSAAAAGDPLQQPASLQGYCTLQHCTNKPSHPSTDLK